jgi:uncharacterized lipoprotein YajG
MKHKHTLAILIVSTSLLVFAGCALMRQITTALTGGGRTSADVWTNAVAITNSP